MNATKLAVPIWLAVLCGTALPTGCGHAPRAHYDAPAQRMCTGKLCYRTGQLGADWRVFHVEKSSVAYYHPSLRAVIESNASCRDDADPATLEVLTRHLLIGYTERRYRKSERVPLAGREALHSVIEVKLDGVPMVLDVYVLKRNGCIFDLSFAAPPAQFVAGVSAFEGFVSGFIDERTS